MKENDIFSISSYGGSSAKIVNKKPLFPKFDINLLFKNNELFDMYISSLLFFD